MSCADRNAVLIGHTGLLGHALSTAIRATAAYRDLSIVDHYALVREVLGGRGAAAVAALLTREPQDWLCATGIVDHRADPGLLARINVEFPRLLVGHMASIAPHARTRLVTFGSILEGWPALAAENSYLTSKRRLYEVLATERRENGPVWRHIRIHTLYGGHRPPHPSMFAGQMLQALATGTDFRMSTGEQLREYHHVDDIALAILSNLAAHDASEVVELSSGVPIRLRDLAVAVFTAFGKPGLLKIGAMPSAGAEIYKNTHQRCSFLDATRDPMQGVVAWFEDLGIARPR